MKKRCAMCETEIDSGEYCPTCREHLGLDDTQEEMENERDLYPERAA